jgi:hypothetical protein
MLKRGLLLASVAWLASPAMGRADSTHDPAAVEFFETKIRPVLVEHCYACHSAETKPAGGLRVDDHNGLLAGGDGGPAVVPRDPDASLLLRRVTHKNAKQRMPKEGETLTNEQVADLTQWIRDGAAWPAVKVPASLGKAKEWYEPLRKEHWAWQPLTDPKPSAVNNATWPKDDIDRFLLAELEKARLQPVGDAERVTLLRRVTFDLTGLPPTPADVDAFVADQDSDAFAKVVDRLLASRQFGERWGRHWLDVARFAESTGPSRNIPYPHAWKYRDYVIDAFNNDVPFDRFITEQVAGDLLPANTPAERDRMLTATGYLALGVKDVNQRFKVRFVMDNVDDQIDAVSRSVLGLTVSCARCHDHKFDPIPTTDYYSLAGIFTSTDNAAGLRNKMGGGGLDYYDPSMLVVLSGNLPPPPEQEVKALEGKLASAKKAWDAIRGTPEGLAKGPDGLPKQRKYRLEYERLRADLLALTDPASRGHAVHGARDAKHVGDTQVRIRGEAERTGPIVPRGFLSAFAVPDARPVNPNQSGRLELARWLASAQNPLTPRVVVNRVWQHLFGRGIVSTVDNFGATGDHPSNPALLDHVARRFVRDGWSTKRLVRAIVLTRAYQLSSDATPEHLAADPANQLVWRHAPRRLDSEEIRDAMLVAAGILDLDRPAGSPTQELKMVELQDNGIQARTIHERANASRHRSIYLPLLRGVTPKALEAFDPVEQTLVTGRRETTTVPSQALYLLNSAFVRRQSLSVAERVLASAGTPDVERVQQTYRFILGREASDAEIARGLAFMTEFESSYPDPESERPHNSQEPIAVAEAENPTKPPQPVNPDEIDQTGVPMVEDVVRAKNPRTDAWLAFAQALFASAEFRYVR